MASNSGDRPLRSPEEMLAAAKTRGRELKRRRRLAIGAAACLAGAGALAGVGVNVFAHSHSRAVVIDGGGSATAAICRAGGPPKPGVARVGASVSFGQLPAGYRAVPGAGYVGGNEAVVATPGGKQLSRARLEVALSFDMTQPAGPNSTTVLVEGHPASLSFHPDTGPVAPGQTTVLWSPGPGAQILVSGQAMPEAQVVSAARSVIYHQGVNAGAIGDLGPAIPRSQAITIAGAAGSGGTPQRVVTWFTDGTEFVQAEQRNGGGKGGTIETQMVQQNPPLWVVAMFGNFPDTGSTAYTNGPNGGTGHVNVAVINAVTGFSFETSQSPDAAIPGDFVSLTDHSTAQPCPSPSPTEPNLQPPQPSTPNPAIPTLVANVTQRGYDGDSLALQLADGTTDGLTGGDTAYIPGEQSVLVGPIVQYGQAWSEVYPYTEVGATTIVRLDPRGDQAEAVGNGDGQPLSLYMINRDVHLRVGTLITTAGPITTGTPAGLAVGTIASFTPATGDHPPTATITPTPTGTPATVTVLKQNPAQAP